MKNQDTDITYDSYIITNSATFKELRKHYSRAECGRIMKLASYLNDINEIVVDNIQVDSSELNSLLGISRGTAYMFLRKLILHSIIVVNIRCIDKKFVRTMLLNPYVAYSNESALGMRTFFEDISKGLEPLAKKTN